MKAKELIAALESLPPDAQVCIYNPEAGAMCNVSSHVSVVILQDYERLAPNCHGLSKGDPNIEWQRIKKGLLISQAHASKIEELARRSKVLTAI